MAALTPASSAVRHRPLPLPSASLAPGGHDPALDGVRGLAILLVLVLHFTLYGGMQPATGLERAFYRVAISGWVGVDLFFVLSGFLITGILYDAKGGPGYFRSFYARRSLRIFPLYYLTLFVFFIVLPRLAPADPSLDALAHEAGWYWAYLVNLRVALLRWSPVGLLEHFWSLSVEEQFYLVWPWLVYALRRRPLMVFCCLSFGAALLVRLGLVQAGRPEAAYVLTPARFDTLAAGAFVALAARGPRDMARLQRWAPWAAAAAALGLVILIGWRGGLEAEVRAVQLVGYPLLALLSAAFLGLTLTRPPTSLLRRALASRSLRFFGQYSYALYVIHHPLVLYLRAWGLGVSAWPRLFGSQLPAQLGFIVLGTLLTVLAALLTWHVVEAPFLRLKRLFPYRSPRPAALAAPAPLPGSTSSPAP
jgi:peptidoglycan/LPS O-acetylase OafA/YrhL